MVFTSWVIGDLEVGNEALKTKEPKEGISELAALFSNRTVTHMQCSTGSMEPETHLHRPFSRLSVASSNLRRWLNHSCCQWDTAVGAGVAGSMRKLGPTYPHPSQPYCATEAHVMKNLA